MMEQLFEEYGGVIIAAFAVVLLIGFFLMILSEGGSLYQCMLQSGNGAC